MQPGVLHAGGRRLWTAMALVAALLALLAYSVPKFERNPLAETTAWSIVTVAAFAGWGSLLRAAVAPRERIDLGLRIAWGMGVLAFLGGMLMVPSLMNRTASFVLIELGVLLAAVSLVRERDAVLASVRFLIRAGRGHRGLALVYVALAGVVAVLYLGGIADWHTNPYDDDIAYIAFAQKVLDTGSLIEPFSLRRLSALGGQSLFHAFVGVRAAPTQAHTFDRSICVLVVVLLIAGFRVGRRRAMPLISVCTIASFLTLPNVAINTASYYSGVVFFLALFRTMLWSGERDRGVIKAAIPLAVISAAACTLRQNYIPVPLVTLGTYYTFRWWYAERGRRTRSLAEAMVVGALLLGALAPWLVVSFQSNRTLFYPLMLGTANPAVSLQSSGITFLRELQIQIGVPLDGLPLKTFAVFLLAVAFLRDEAPGRPLWALTMGSIAGSIAVVHGLTQSDAGNIARYAFGFFLALALAVALSSSILRPSAASRSMVPAGLVLLGMAVQFPASRESFIRASTYALQNIDVLAHQAPRSARSSTPEAQLYSALQGSIPASARVAVMVDEPHYLNFARNPIWNLDMPGYSSLPPNLPYFQGSEKVVEYFRGLGVRYLAFVAEGYSRYHYRRSYWVEMLIDEQEIWRVHAPYLIDFVDNLAAIGRRYHHVFDERGMLVVDLEAPP